MARQFRPYWSVNGSKSNLFKSTTKLGLLGIPTLSANSLIFRELVPSGAITTVTEELTLATYTATIDIQNVVDSNVKDLTLTTYVAEIALQNVVTTNVRPLSLATYISSITYDINLSTIVHNLDITTYAAGIALQGQPEAADDWFNGVWWLTPFWASTWWPLGISDVEVTNIVENLVLTGQIAQILKPINVNTNVEALTLTTYPATLTHIEEADEWFNGIWWKVPFWDSSWWGIGVPNTIIETNVEALTLTTYPATLIADSIVDTNVEALTLTTYTSSISINIATNVEALTLTTYPATFVISVEINANTYNMVLTTYPVGIIGDVTVITNVEALTLTTYTANPFLWHAGSPVGGAGKGRWRSRFYRGIY